MSLWKQILAGSGVLSLCVILHVAVLAAGIEALKLMFPAGEPGPGALRELLLILAASGVVLAGHTLQVWAWAVAFRAAGALDDLGTAVYFALVTTTTLGYGDVTLERDHRAFGAMAAVAGLMTFGLSTAFLVGAIGGLLRPLT